MAAGREGRGLKELNCRGEGVTKGSVGTSRACPAIAIQIAATNAISIGFGQQVGEWEGEWEREGKGNGRGNGCGHGLDHPRVWCAW